MRLSLVFGLAFSVLAALAPFHIEFLPSAIAEITQAEQTSSNSLGDRIYEKAEWVFDHANDVAYRHFKHPATEQIHDEDGRMICHNDCSGLVSYLIHSIGPRHYAAIRDRQPERPYPQAKVYAKFFASLSPDSARDGWIGVASYRDLRRGDFIAWEKGGEGANHSGKGNSGHVMVVRERPAEPFRKEIEGKNYILVDVPVIDSSSVYHFPPETLPPQAGQQHRNGLGKGNIRLVVDEQGRVVGYWEGSYWGEGEKEVTHPTASGMIHFGRMVPEQQ